MWTHKALSEFKAEMSQCKDNVLKIGSLATATVSLSVGRLAFYSRSVTDCSEMSVFINRNRYILFFVFFFHVK